MEEQHDEHGIWALWGLANRTASSLESHERRCLEDRTNTTRRMDEIEARIKQFAIDVDVKLSRLEEIVDIGFAKIGGARDKILLGSCGILLTGLIGLIVYVAEHKL